MLNKNQKIINKTIEVLESGGIILYPTDTIWGIGCDATNENAINKIYEIKKRQKNKPLILLIHDVKLLEKYISNVPKIASKLIQNSTQPTTIIYENPKNLPKTLVYQNTIGIRVVNNHEISIVLKKFNKPITSSSANISNSMHAINFSEIDEYIKNNVDYIVPENFTSYKNTKKSSTIVKIHSDSRIQTIRK